MQLKPIILVAALFSFAARLSAQDVLVEVVELSNGRPIVGASVSLLDDHGNGLLGNFSDQGGHTVLPAPHGGTYVVRADKVGYETWSSVVLHVAGEPIHVRVGMAPLRNPSTVVARSESTCQLLTGPGTAAGDLWVEIRKALTASALTEAQGYVPLDVVLYERTLDRNLAVVSERTEQRSRVSRRPSVGITWDQVDSTRGGAVAGGEVYRAPDAATLVSDQFVKSHCFAAIRGYGPETGLAGLEFKPARIGSQPELTGVMWLDPVANTLRSVNFDYVNLPIPLRVARTSGRIEFEELSSGQWIVPRWYIRMPRVSQVAGEAGPQSAARDTLLGYQEVGGASRPAGASSPTSTGGNGSASPASSLGSGSAGDSTTTPAVPQSLITGMVYDSTASRGLSGVQVSTGGGRFRTTTTAGGHYELAVTGALSDTIVFEHPRLRLFRVADRMQVISLPAGAHGVANVLMPSYETLRRSLCGQNETATESQGIVAGYVRDARGDPVPHAHVWATWQLLWVEQNGRLVSTNQQRTAEADTGNDGSYLMCGFTRDAKITAKVGVAGRSTIEEKLSLPASLVLEHDFTVGSR